MTSANRYKINDKIKLVYFVLPDGKTYSKISLDGFLAHIYKKRVDPKDITVKMVVVTISTRTEHNNKDVGFCGKSGAWDCENQIMYYRKDSLYLLDLIPKNKYDYEWLVIVNHKTVIKAFDAIYIADVFSRLDKRFASILDQVKAIL